MQLITTLARLPARPQEPPLLLFVGEAAHLLHGPTHDTGGVTLKLRHAAPPSPDTPHTPSCWCGCCTSGTCHPSTPWQGCEVTRVTVGTSSACPAALVRTGVRHQTTAQIVRRAADT